MNQALNDLDDSQWQGLEPAAKNLMLAFTILPFLIPIVPAAVLPITLMPGWWGLAVTVPVAAGCLILGVTVGRNRWLYTRWRLDEDGFRLRKGRWWQKEIFVPRSRVIALHAFRNALIPVVTVIGLQVGVLFTGAILTETIFSWPGVGKWLIEAINRRDYPVLQGGLLLLGVVVMVVNLLVDLTYGVINPRIRHAR